MRLIDADDFRADIMNLWDYNSVDDITAETVLKQVLHDLDNAPTVELLMGRMVNGVIIPIKRPQGEWIVKSSGTTHYFMCSKCGSAGDIQDKYCRECGLKMKARTENETDN